MSTHSRNKKNIRLVKSTAKHRQLFHWFGGDIEKQKKSHETYMAYLNDQLAHGLRLTTKRAKADEILGQCIYDRPFVCFTENRLSECMDHAEKFGRMALGFGKKFVVEAGGRPVDYVRNRKGVHDLFLTMMLRLYDLHPQSEELKYILSFLKPMSPKPEVMARKAGAPKRTLALENVAQIQHKKNHTAQSGPDLIFQDEREWRVVYDHALKRLVQDEKQPEMHRLPFRAGMDLRTIIFPSRKIQYDAIMNHPTIKNLMTCNPPVRFFNLEEINEL